MINTSNLNEARKEILKLKNNAKIVMVRAQGDEFNRKIVENPDVDILLGLEMHNRKDYLKQRDSGLNEILCKLARKNNIRIGIDLKDIIKLKGAEKARVLSRVMQNIKLCRRIGTQIIFYPDNYSKQDIFSLFVSLGASTQQMKNSFK